MHTVLQGHYVRCAICARRSSMLNTILVPLDGSKRAEGALALATTLGSVADAVLHRGVAPLVLIGPAGKHAIL
jgi:hypothetical protein